MLRSISAALFVALCVFRSSYFVFQNWCESDVTMFPCAGGAAGGGYAQVIPMEEVRQRGRQQVPVPLGWVGRPRWPLQRLVGGEGLPGEMG